MKCRCNICKAEWEAAVPPPACPHCHAGLNDSKFIHEWERAACHLEDIKGWPNHVEVEGAMRLTLVAWWLRLPAPDTDMRRRVRTRIMRRLIETFTEETKR